MIGWTRRGEESRRRRAAWLSTLTADERAEEADYQAYVWRVWCRWAPLFFLASLGLLFLADWASRWVGTFPIMMISFVSIPLSMSAPVFIADTKRRWRGRRSRKEEQT